MPHVELPQAEFKVVMLGETFTGKTSLVLRFAEGYYRDSARDPTVGAFFITKRLTVNGTTAKIQIWDTAGQEQFKKLAPMYYKNAEAAIVCYDVTSPKSFETLEYWIDELLRNTPVGSLVIAMCATKCDLAMNPDTSQAEALAARTGAIFFTTSAKANTNVNLLFHQVTERVLHCQRRNGGPSDLPTMPGSTSVETRSRCATAALTPPARASDSPSDNPLNGYSTSHQNAGRRIGLPPLPGVPEDDGVRSPIDGKRQRPEADDSNDMLDPANIPSADSDRDAANVARCDPHNMLMCGGVDEGDGGGGCFIQ